MAHIVKQSIKHCGHYRPGERTTSPFHLRRGVEGAPRVEPINALGHSPTPPSILFNTSLFHEKAPTLGPKPEQKGGARIFSAPPGA